MSNSNSNSLLGLTTVDEVDEEEDYKSGRQRRNTNRSVPVPVPVPPAPGSASGSGQGSGQGSGHGSGHGSGQAVSIHTSADNESNEFPRQRGGLGFGFLAKKRNPQQQQQQQQQHMTEDDTLNTQPNQPKPTQSQQRSGLLARFSFRNGGSLDDNILKQSALRRSSVRTSGATRQPLAGRTVSSTMAFAKRNVPTKLAPTNKNAQAAAAVVQEQDKARATYRRYRVGDSVLVCNTQSRWANLVNRYGYPAGGGVAPEELRGPYIYVLATLKKVHFEEDAEYYTVTRADTGADQRADAGKWRCILNMHTYMHTHTVLYCIVLYCIGHPTTPTYTHTYTYFIHFTF